MIETLLVLSIILLVTIIGISNNFNIKSKIEQEQIVKILEIDYFNTKKLAMINESKYCIIFEYDNYYITKDDIPIKIVNYPKGVVSDINWTLSFTSRGNIGRAKSFMLGNYRIVFNLGSGGFYYEKQ